MKPLPIIAASAFAQVAPEAKNSLRDTLRARCPNAARRISRMTELGLIGVHGCVADRRPAIGTAIYMAYTSGCIADSADLLRSAVHGLPLKPVDFINVSSNMTGFQIAASLGVDSSNQVVASNDFAWEAALELACLGGGESFLVGGVEECAWPLSEHRERLGLAASTLMLETSTWLWADRAAEGSPLGTIHWLMRHADDAAMAQFLNSQEWPADTQLCLLGAPALPGGMTIGLHVAEGLLRGEHSGMRGASACIRFLESGGGRLLYLNRGLAGCWYAALISVNRTSRLTRVR